MTALGFELDPQNVKFTKQGLMLDAKGAARYTLRVLLMAAFSSDISLQNAQLSEFIVTST